MKAKWTLSILFAMTQLCACVEVRDNKKTEEPAPMVAVQKFGDLVIDEPMYVYAGQILNAQDLAAAQKESGKEPLKESLAKNESLTKQDFEFQFDRLTITERGVLYTLGNNIRLHVADLSSAGLITTFSEDQTAEPNKVGRAGGHILIDVERAEGVLNLVLRGERGGKGLKGANPDPSMKGSEGSPGTDGDAFGSNGICNRRATGGGIGGQGKKGHPGQDGKNGGDSGTLELKIKNDQGFTYSIQRKPGRGGERGEGGQGGEGGENGRSGSASFSCGGFVLSLGNEKNRGPEGEPGDKGQPGVDGISQTVCIDKNSVLTCY
ncbi:hypothetical protein [Bdellovibrio svalbardensis]|uniref:Collagen-like protein n=1 Tax=Bdellovibrio svalbardensis TaxID=2972972 RepID=A0ABT6DJG0_9BACT|nr:hypothetical protein [Bdellovibrio svalbardensis]MDG0816975.1 hypothetical protein [Bdellovibrio svalbardensis]